MIKELAFFLNFPCSQELACFEMGILPIFLSEFFFFFFLFLNAYHPNSKTTIPVFGRMIVSHYFL